jgi:molybdenum-dependent DNA-binding transcriptional regulator ModE
VKGRIPRNGELLEWHLAILRTVQEIQPCGSTSVAKKMGLPYFTIRDALFRTFNRRGLIESDIVRIPGCKPRRKYGTIRLTEAGEKLINERIEA